jgi:tetratricopeptide (TPR) repeat protein
MKRRAAPLSIVATIAGLMASVGARADERAETPELAPQSKQETSKQEAPAEQTPAAERAELYERLRAAKDADETAGLVGLLLHTYSQSGSDTGDLLLERARTAMRKNEYSAALKVLDETVALLPDWAEGWNARATARYLDDDYEGSMADIAETLKREPRHLGALMGMATILEARGKDEEALQVYQRALDIAPHWRNAEESVERLKASLAGKEL